MNMPISMLAALAAATRTLADGVLDLLQPEERVSAEQPSDFRASRFWVLAQRELGGGTTIVCWSQVVTVAMHVARFATAAGLNCVCVVDTETDEILEHAGR